MVDLQQAVGVVIRRERRLRGMTLRELAERSALSTVYLGEIERGKKYPSALVLERLAQALGLTVPDLLELLADELRGVRQPTMAIGFSVPARREPTPPKGTAGNVLNMLVA
jgi:transcriptional regulator with XRE-family HTH domain